ncbi:aldehyde dehydrogenase family protein [Elusimicrobiota bacterium]
MTNTIIKVTDKYTGEVLGELQEADREGVKSIIECAQEAFAPYSELPAHLRSKILENASFLIGRYKKELARTIASEAGKALKYAMGEVDRAVETFKFASEEAKRIHGETLPMDASASGEGRLGFYLRMPIGVIAAISPFNFPLNLVAHKVAPALASGNTVVLKPATTTPLSAIKLAEILKEAGLPDGVFNIVCGSGSTVGSWIVEDPRPAMVTFTGSPSVGEEITRHAGLKKIALELGNNSGTMIEPDSDWKEAVGRCVMSAFANSGQVCISLQRLYVHESIAKDFIAEFVHQTSSLKVGNPMDEKTDVGPMITESEAIRAEEWIKEAQEAGARVLAGGARKNAVLMPTVLTDVKPDMKVVCEEVFAPVVCIIPYSNFEKGLSMLADSKYGLQAGLYTKDITKIMQAVKKVDVGGMMINDTSIFRTDHMPYGGNKLSGIGREGVKFAMEEMTNLRMVVIK